MPMTPFDRKVELLRANVSQAEIGRRAGYGRAYVHEVVSGDRRNAKIEQAVAAAIGRPLADVFPPPESASTPAGSRPAVPAVA